MRDDLLAAVRDCRADPEMRAILLTGTGDSFCAGMDLRASTVAQAGGEGFETRSTSEALRAGVQAIVRELWELDKPTVAAVNGTAVGPGAHLALAARLAAGPTRSLGLSKQLLNRSFESSFAESLDLEGAYQSLAATSADLAEGMAAFKDKRDPKFTGR